MRTATILAPFLCSACFGLVAPVVARRLPPRQATWLVSAGAAIAALSPLAVLALVGFVLVAEVPDIAHLGHWSTAALEDHAPTEPGIGALSLLSALGAAVAVTVAGARQARAVLSAYRSCKTMSIGGGELVVVTGASAGAVAVPGRPGRIVVAQSLLAALSGPDRSALLAHERAHLEHGHHWHRSAVSLACAANPLLAPLRGAVVQATERWADEEAAAEVGDRRSVAATLARVALITGRVPGAVGPRLALAEHAVADRVAALFNPPPRSRPLLSLLMMALLLVSAVTAVVVGKETEHAFELAGRVYRAGHG